MARLPASEATRKRIDAMIDGEGDAVEKSELVRAAVCPMVEESREGEVTDAPGRESSTSAERSRAVAIATATRGT